MTKPAVIDPRYCDFIKKDGNQCRNGAGKGTAHKGRGRCRTHGGNSPSHVKAAARATIADMANEADADPYDVLLKVIRLDWGAVQYIRSQIAERASEEPSEDLDERKLQVVMTKLYEELYGEWVDRAAKHAKLALDAGIADRQVRVAEQQGQLMAVAIRTILDGLGLTKAQQDRAPQLVRTALLQLEPS